MSEQIELGNMDKKENVDLGVNAEKDAEEDRHPMEIKKDADNLKYIRKTVY